MQAVDRTLAGFCQVEQLDLQPAFNGADGHAAVFFSRPKSGYAFHTFQNKGSSVFKVYRTESPSSNCECNVCC